MSSRPLHLVYSKYEEKGGSFSNPNSKLAFSIWTKGKGRKKRKQRRGVESREALLTQQTKKNKPKKKLRPLKKDDNGLSGLRGSSMQKKISGGEEADSKLTALQTCKQPKKTKKTRKRTRG